MAIIASASTSWLRSRNKGPDLEGKQVQAAIGCIYAIRIVVSVTIPSMILEVDAEAEMFIRYEINYGETEEFKGQSVGCVVF